MNTRATANGMPHGFQPTAITNGQSQRGTERHHNGNHNVALSPKALKSSGWVDRWLATCSDLAALERSNPMTRRVIDEIDGTG